MGNRNFVVGIFVTFALGAMVVLTLWLSGRQGNEATSTYSMFFERDVSGLMLGGPVFYLGVEVGNVTRTQIIAGDPMSVRVDIEVLDSTPVDTGTWASLLYQGITGVAVINLSGDPGMNLPLKTPPGEQYPLIEVRDSGLAAVLANAPVIMQRLDDLLERASLVLGGENRELITETLSNLEAVTDSLTDEAEGFASLPAEINTTLADIRSGVALLRETASEMRPGMVSSVEQLASASENLARLTDRLESWTTDNDQDVEVFLSGGLGQVPDLIADTRAALREVEKLMRSLREEPSRLIYRPAGESAETER